MPPRRKTPRCLAILDDGKPCGAAPVGADGLCAECREELDEGVLDRAGDAAERFAGAVDRIAGSLSRAWASLKRQGQPPPSAPPPKSPKTPNPAAALAQARRLYGLGETYTEEQVREKRKLLARLYHTDGGAGDVENMKRANAAGDLLLRHLKASPKA